MCILRNATEMPLPKHKPEIVCIITWLSCWTASTSQLTGPQYGFHWRKSLGHWDGIECANLYSSPLNMDGWPIFSFRIKGIYFLWSPISYMNLPTTTHTKGFFSVILHLHHISQAKGPKSSNPKIKFSAKNLDCDGFFDGLLNTLVPYESLMKAFFLWGEMGFPWANNWLKSVSFNDQKGIVMKKPTAMGATPSGHFVFGASWWFFLIDSLRKLTITGDSCWASTTSIPLWKFGITLPSYLPLHLPHPPASWDPNAAKPSQVLWCWGLYLRSTPKRQTANILISPHHALLMTCLELRLRWERLPASGETMWKGPHLFSKSQPVFTC